MSEQLAAVARALSENEENEQLRGGIMVGFVAVSEWMSPDGRRWLTMLAADGEGVAVPKWQTRGYLHEALFEWPSDDEE